MDKYRDLINMLFRAREWSRKTFGEGMRTEGVINHIKSELKEIKKDPKALEEWIDVAILAFDGASRAGYSPAEIALGIEAKYEKNFLREWPEPGPEDTPVYHVKEIKQGGLLSRAIHKFILGETKDE